MKNTIKFYYEMENFTINIINNRKYIKCDEKLYTFEEIENPDIISEIFNMTRLYPEFEKIKINKNRSIFTEYNGKKYALIEKNMQKSPYPITRVINSNVQYLADRTKWDLLWERKIDYIEYVNKHIKGKYRYIDESINYYIGMAENAISYFKYNLKEINKPKTLSRNRMKEEEYYNPLNIVIDYKMRDVAEYLKEKFWSDNRDGLQTGILLKNLDLTDSKLIISRLLFPDYYFDVYEKIINNIYSQEEMKKIIRRIEEYESYIYSIFKILKSNHTNLPIIKWIKVEK